MRPGELRAAEWAGFAFGKAEWRIPEHRWRGADLEWLTSEANFLKVIEGNYDKPVRGEGAMNA